MFGYNILPETDNTLDDLSLHVMKTMAISDMSVPFQCFFEAAIPPNLTNNSIFNTLTHKFGNSIDLIYKNLENITISTVTFITEKTRYMTDLYERYKEKINSLSDMDLSNLLYQNISFNINELIPAKIDTNSLNKYINALDNSIVNKDDVKKLKKVLFEYSIKSARGDILLFKRPMTAAEFENTYHAIFKDDAFVVDTSLTKTEVLKLYSRILSYDKDITNIKRSFDVVKKVFSIYGEILEHILNSNHHSNMVVKSNRAKDERIDVIAIAAYNEYKSLLIKYIINILDMYANVYQYKVLMAKEKIMHDNNILKSIIDHINQTPILESSIGRLNFSQKINPDFQKKQQIDLSSLTEIVLTKDNLDEIKKKYSGDFKFRFKFSIRDGIIEIYWYKDKETVAEAIVDKTDTDKIILDHLAVNQKYQGSGLSKQILNYLVNKYKIRYLEVFASGEVAARLYRDYGFKEYKREDGVIFMKLE